MTAVSPARWWPGSRRLLAALAAVALAGAGQAASGRGRGGEGGGLHVVRRGDTLSALARRYDVTVVALARANEIDNLHHIRIGQRLAIPGDEEAAAATLRPEGGGTAGRDRLPPRLRERPDRLALLPVFDAAARRHGIPADLLKAMTWLESGWQNDQVSSTGARGIGQLMPATVAFVNDILLRADKDPARPADNIEMSARFLAYLLAQNRGNAGRALASYYQGLTSVRRYGPGRATQRYVADVLALRPSF